MSDPRQQGPGYRTQPERRQYMVQDCGQIIRPDELKNQIEGNVIKTVSRILLEELTWDRSMVTSLDWTSYPIISFPVPEVVIELIDRPNEEPWEPSAVVIPLAISSAVFDSIGVRLRSMPFTPAKVKPATRFI
jgi:nicotinate dehydrogenase subunit B